MRCSAGEKYGGTTMDIRRGGERTVRLQDIMGSGLGRGMKIWVRHGEKWQGRQEQDEAYRGRMRHTEAQ